MIGTNKKDAAETVELLLEDARAGLLARRAAGDLDALLASAASPFVDYAGWEAIDAHEREPRRAARPPAREALDLGRRCSPAPGRR